MSALYRPLQERLVREQTEQNDETYYLWALSFFMAFNRGNGFRADLVSETMTIRAFHFIERNITNYYEMILTDRKEATSWSRRWGRRGEAWIESGRWDLGLRVWSLAGCTWL